MTQPINNLNFVIYNADGEIIRVGSCQESDIELQAMEGEWYVIGIGDSSTHYVKDGKILQYPYGVVQAKAEGYAPWMKWSNKTLSYTDLRALSAIKDQKWAEIKNCRIQAEAGPFIWDGSQFDSDPLSQSRIQGIVQLAMLNPDLTVNWTLYDNTVRVLTAAELIQVGFALLTFIDGIHARSRKLRSLIDAATTIEEVNNIDWCMDLPSD